LSAGLQAGIGMTVILIEIIQSDFESGGFHMNSFIRAQRIFTMDKRIVRYSAGKLSESKIKEVESMLIRIFTG